LDQFFRKPMFIKSRVTLKYHTSCSVKDEDMQSLLKQHPKKISVF